MTDRFDVPFDVDDVVAFHAARLLVLIRLVGNPATGLLYGRTKLTKLDFFIRYPTFLVRAISILRAEKRTTVDYEAGADGVEATMIRYRYGPWDPRMTDYLGYLSSRQLIKVAGQRVETYSLTPLG